MFLMSNLRFSFVLRNTPLTMYSLLWIAVITVSLIKRYRLDKQSLDLSFSNDKNGLQSLLKHWKFVPALLRVRPSVFRAVAGAGAGGVGEGDDASWGDLADDEIWGPATRCYALFSHRPLLSSPLDEREGDTTIEVGKATTEKMPFDVAEEICTFFHPHTSPAPPNPRTFDSSPIWT
jgi:hypothetical protein